MMCVGVVGALEPEIRAFKPKSPQKRIGDAREVVVLVSVSGAGMERAYRAGKLLVEQGATALVSWGTAAALVPTLAPGTLLLPRTVIARDGRAFAIDAAWQERIRKRLPADVLVHTGPLGEAAAPLLTVADKRSLAERSGAHSADMVSAALAALAESARIPLVVVRAVVDHADLAVPSRLAGAMRPDGGLRVAAALGWLAISPSQWPSALRLALGFRAALLTLERVACEVLA
jgi:adenosylhomocysteine nucleosidase